MKSSKRLIAFLIAAILGISFSFYGYQMVYTPNILVGKEPRVIIIPDTASFKAVQEILHQGDYVQDLVSFSFVAKLMKYHENVKPGRYLLRGDMTNVQAVRLLRSGDQLPVRITFNNIRTVDELAVKITKKLRFTADEFKAALFAFVDSSSSFTRENVIAMFIPNTYEVYYNVSAEKFISRMQMEYTKFWDDERKRKADEIGLSPTEIATLASVVQAETINPLEAPTIAGLYLNRLKQEMPLQADPTLKFALGDFSIKRILLIHTQVNSPYNTYRHTGLPPGPINMPEIAAIEAVLNYHKSDYLYMCAKEDFSGSHNFTSSYREHLNNASKYQTALTHEERIGRQLRNQ